MTAEYIISTDAPRKILVTGSGTFKPFIDYLNGEIIESFNGPICEIPFTQENALKLRTFLKGKDYEIPAKERVVLKYLADNPEALEDKKIRWNVKLTDLSANKLPKKFAKIVTEWDLVHYFPLRYLDKSNPQKVSELIIGQWAVIAGTVISCDFNPAHNFTKIVIADITGQRISATFFRQKWLSWKFKPGEEVLLYGNYSEYVNKKNQNRFPQISNPSLDKITSVSPTGQPLTQGYGMLPIYPQKSEDRSWQLKVAQEELLNSIVWIEDPVPEAILKKYDLPNRTEAYKNIHFPKDKVDVEKARRRIAFDEFVRLQIYIQTKKTEHDVQTSSRKTDNQWSDAFISALPFKFTNAQTRVTEEIRENLKSNTPMNRLLQGDVGSGKAQPLYSKILTPTGFTTMGEIQPGDKILTPNGKTETVLNVFPQGLRPVYELTFKDKTRVKADINHLWKVTQHNQGKINKPKIVTTEFLLNNLNQKNNKTTQWFIEYPETIADYGTKWDNTTPPYTLGTLLDTSKITTDVLNSNKKSRIALLQGLMDTNGTCPKKTYKTIKFTSKSKKLVENVAFLMRSLAGKAKISHQKQKNNETWSVQGWLPEQIKPFTKGNKKTQYSSQKNRPPKQAKPIINIRYVGEEETKCILISGEEHLYITDDFTPTHNTELASAAVLTTVKSGYQAAMLAPTDILANQLHERLDNTFKKAGLQVNVALFTGKVLGKKRKQLLEDLEKGDIDVLVGTHALTQDYVKFKNLGLAVLDEQHKYGSLQRSALKKENPDGSVPDMLAMSATPIPRTTSQVLYGDMDISIVDELPAERLPIQTFWDETPDVAWAKIREEVEAGHKAYVVAALVEDSDKDIMLNVESATSTAEELQARFPNFKVGLLHGKMHKNDKEIIANDFIKGDTQILVATSLIEVGLNNPNATVMTILNANRFGIASLHQIRGRVGRGSLQSYCYLVGEATMPEAEERLNALVASNDGFWLAEKDLEIRGEGSLFGTFQSGDSDLYLANLKEHKDLLEVAKRVAGQAGQNPLMKHEVKTLYKDKTILG